MNEGLGLPGTGGIYLVVPAEGRDIVRNSEEGRDIVRN